MAFGRPRRRLGDARNFRRREAFHTKTIGNFAARFSQTFTVAHSAATPLVRWSSLEGHCSLTCATHFAWEYLPLSGRAKP